MLLNFWQSIANCELYYQPKLIFVINRAISWATLHNIYTTYFSRLAIVTVSHSLIVMRIIRVFVRSNVFSCMICLEIDSIDYNFYAFLLSLYLIQWPDYHRPLLLNIFDSQFLELSHMFWVWFELYYYTVVLLSVFQLQRHGYNPSVIPSEL